MKYFSVSRTMSSRVTFQVNLFPIPAFKGDTVLSQSEVLASTLVLSKLSKAKLDQFKSLTVLRRRELPYTLHPMFKGYTVLSKSKATRAGYFPSKSTYSQNTISNKSFVSRREPSRTLHPTFEGFTVLSNQRHSSSTSLSI